MYRTIYLKVNGIVIMWNEREKYIISLPLYQLTKERIFVVCLRLKISSKGGFRVLFYYREIIAPFKPDH